MSQRGSERPARAKSKDQISRSSRPKSKQKSTEGKEGTQKTQQKENEKPEKAKAKKGNRKSRSRGPPTVLCYLCGRPYGTQSIAIHEPNCVEKWKAENDKLPEELQQSVPKKPVLSADKALDLDAMNEAAYEASQAAMVPCHNCNRTFFPDRLLVHQRSCTKQKPHEIVPKRW